MTSDPTAPGDSGIVDLWWICLCPHTAWQGSAHLSTDETARAARMLRPVSCLHSHDIFKALKWSAVIGVTKFSIFVVGSLTCSGLIDASIAIL
ncbi:hypothetical protein [Streptacidiphilus cavernicola]|uniref:Uncharacterized protein n=1 Tax=Streptacidiphilus cavernicola TaxID=3342716 RepID=A0ABV6W6E7_9ACTN